MMYVRSTAATSTDRTSSTRILRVKAERLIVNQDFAALDRGDDRSEIRRVRLLRIRPAVRGHHGHRSVDIMTLRQNPQQPVQRRSKRRIRFETLSEPRLRA